MKILALTLPRSKSNWILNQLSIHYNTPHLSEPYRKLFGLPHDIDQHRLITESLSSLNGAMKIEITQFTDRHNKNKLIDLDVFDFNRFDKIFTTERLSFVDMVCSHRVACEHDRWAFTPDNPPPEVQPLVFSMSDIKSIISLRRCLVDVQTLKYIQAWLSSNNIEYTPLYYETMDDYVRNEFGIVQQQTLLATNYDYSKIFTNYGEIGSLIDSYNFK